MVEANDALYRSVKKVHKKIQINVSLTAAGSVALFLIVNIRHLVGMIHVLHMAEEEYATKLDAQMQHMVHYTNVLHMVAVIDALCMAVQD